MQYGISTKGTGGTGTFDVQWHGGTGLFSVTEAGSGFQATKVTLQHDVSAAGETANYVSLGSDAEFTANGQTLFTTASKSLRVSFTSGGSENYHIIVQAVNERSAY